MEEGGGGGAALGMSADCLELGGGCDGSGGGTARGAEEEGSGGGMEEGDPKGDRPEVLSSKLESLACAFKASLCGAAEAMSVS